VGRVFGFLSGELGSIPGLCATLRFLPCQIRSATLNSGGPLIKETKQDDVIISCSNH